MRIEGNRDHLCPCPLWQVCAGHGGDVKAVDWHPTKSLLVSGGSRWQPGRKGSFERALLEEAGASPYRAPPQDLATGSAKHRERGNGIGKASVSTSRAVPRPLGSGAPPARPPARPSPCRSQQGRSGEAVVPQVGPRAGHAARAQGHHHGRAVERQRQLGAHRLPRPDVQGGAGGFQGG